MKMHERSRACALLPAASARNRPSSDSPTKPALPRRKNSRRLRHWQSRSKMVPRLINVSLHSPYRRLAGNQLLRQIVFSAHVGEPPAAALKQIRELLMLQPQEREHGCVQIVDMHLILHGAETEIIGLPEGPAPLDPAPRHPRAESVRTVVAAPVPL